MKQEKSCGAIVFDENNHVLLVQMRQGHWSFPKGHVEPNETEHETAIRETLEETNIRIEIDSDFREISSYSPSEGAWKDVVFFIGEPLSRDIVIQQEELESAGFYPVEQALKKITFEADFRIFQNAIKFKGQK
ncbi:MAG: NUDIX domain-containing protein [Bacilli bacterium]|nr:NUDIX domain-containing protein [Bacilli bacterium]